MISEEKILQDFFESFNEVLKMASTGQERNVLTTQTANWVIDTSEVSDRDWRFETAVANKEYNKGEWIIVGKSDNKDDSIQIHETWNEYLRVEPYPEILVDIYSGEVFSRV